MSGISNTVAGVVNAAVPGYATPIAGSDGTNLRLISTDTTGKVNVVGTFSGAPFAATPNAPAIVAISTTSTSVLGANASRTGVQITNMSFETISLGFGANPAVLYSGVTLGPGGSFWMDSFDFTTAAIAAISTNLFAATGNLSVQEFQ